MAIRITSSTDGKWTTVQVEGRLDAAAIPDLSAECNSARDSIRIDLSGLMSADQDAIGALRSLAAEGAELTGASSYISQLLGDALRGQE